MADLSEHELARLARGRKAMDLLGAEITAEAFDYLTDVATAEWRTSASANYDAREEAFRQVAALDALKAQLSAWAEDARGLAHKQQLQRARDEAKAIRPRRFGVV